MAGIGTLGEKSLHRMLKWHYEPTGKFHEVSVGRYIADIKQNEHIMEIQTRQWHKLRDKLNHFLPDYIVTVVYPVVYDKRLLWVDGHDSVIRSRRSPKHSTYQTAFIELYAIKSLLTHKNLRLRLVMVCVDEKRGERGNPGANHVPGAHHDKIDTILRSVAAELVIESPADYAKLLPPGLGERFTSQDYATFAHINKRLAGVSLNVLLSVGTVKRVGKLGRCFLYERAQ
ncbi:MAG: hypothetical protein LBL96_10305 [Clostridiales bacterium]|nr:hypothetical protein [Clostridiales bacterium]